MHCQCYRGHFTFDTHFNNIKTLNVLKEANKNFCIVPCYMSIPIEEENKNPCNFLEHLCTASKQTDMLHKNQQLTWFLFQQEAGPLPLLELSHLLLQEVRCE